MRDRARHFQDVYHAQQVDMHNPLHSLPMVSTRSDGARVDENGGLDLAPRRFPDIDGFVRQFPRHRIGLKRRKKTITKGHQA